MTTFIDLFCGIGGFRVALQGKGLQCLFSSDIDKHAQIAYRNNFGELPWGDITEISVDKIPNHDVLCAGFPCQPFSIAGKMSATLDPRGRLFYEVIRIVKHHKPKVVMLENVKNILTIDKGSVVKDIEHRLNEEGYVLHRHLLNASKFGVPQARERVYFVAIRKNLLNSYQPPVENEKKIYLEDILESSVDEKFYVTRDDIVIERDSSQLPYMLKPLRIGYLNKGGQGERIYSSRGHAITQSAHGGGVGARTGLYQTHGGIRRLTINECKQVMGFPLSHIVSDGMQGYQQLGNAVIPPMIGYVWDNIKESITC